MALKSAFVIEEASDNLTSIAISFERIIIIENKLEILNAKRVKIAI